MRYFTTNCALFDAVTDTELPGMEE